MADRPSTYPLRTVMVVAGNQGEFRNHISDLISKGSVHLVGVDRAMIDGVRYIYVTGPERLRGVHGVDFVFHGTWHERRDIDDIRMIAGNLLIEEGREVPWR